MEEYPGSPIGVANRRVRGAKKPTKKPSTKKSSKQASKRAKLVVDNEEDEVAGEEGEESGAVGWQLLSAYGDSAKDVMAEFMKPHKAELQANFANLNWKYPFFCYQGKWCAACNKAENLVR